MLERLNEELRRRTRVVRIFPNAASCLRLVRALCVETHESWLEDQPLSQHGPATRGAQGATEEGSLTSPVTTFAQLDGHNQQTRSAAQWSTAD